MGSRSGEGSCCGFLEKWKRDDGGGWWGEDEEAVVQDCFQSWTCLRKEIFSPEKSFRAEKRRRGVILVATAFSRAFIEYSSLRIGLVEGTGDGKRKSSNIGTYVDPVSTEVLESRLRSQSRICWRVSFCSFRLLTAIIHGMKMTETSIATIPGVNLVMSQKQYLFGQALGIPCQRGGTKYLLAFARPEEW